MYLPNKSLHWTGIPLRSIPASELGRSAEKNKLHVYGILKQGGRLCHLLKGCLSKMLTIYYLFSWCQQE